jgi:DNA-binding HxlR family transcriptional regulator
MAHKAALPGFCPITATMDLLDQKWVLHIVHALLPGKKRFNEIGHALGGVNPRTLRERLRNLEEQRIVSRRVLSEIPPWVEYELTEKGRALEGVLDAMARWARCWVPPPVRPEKCGREAA